MQVVRSMSSVSSLSHFLVRELRSDHAGETGAVSIYKGIGAVAKFRRDSEMLAFASDHGKTEAEHLVLIETLLPKTDQSALLGPWRLAGWLTGAIPAVFGRQAVYATIAAVETFVDQHYQQQIDYLNKFGDEGNLLPLLTRCQADEQHHRDEAAGLLLHPPGFILRSWCWMVGFGSQVAVMLARRV